MADFKMQNANFGTIASMAARFVLLLLNLALMAPLAAQPPIPEPEPEPEPEKPAAKDGMSREEIEDLIEKRLAEQREGFESYLDEEVDQAVRRRFEDFAPIRSRRELFIEFSGGLTVKYRQAQKSAEGDQPDGGHRAPTGIALDDAWFSIFAGYSDVVESELQFRYNGDYTLLDEEIIEIPRGVIIYNRPFGQFVPGGDYADSFLFGIDGHFWRQSRASETMALGQRAFHEDEVAQIRYTARILQNFYVIGALSDGTLLGRGHAGRQDPLHSRAGRHAGGQPLPAGRVRRRVHFRLQHDQLP
jgi:hypothetical protein